jgi:protein SCO1/2
VPQEVAERSKLARYSQTFAMYVAPVLIAGALIAFFTLRAYGVLPRLGVGPGFALIDQAGQTVTSEDLRGSVVVYSFGYTGCDDECDDTFTIVNDTQARLAELGLPPEVPVEFVTISLDPERDSPGQLASFVAANGLAAPNWRFLTGNPTVLKTIVGHGFEVFYEELPDGTLRFEPTIVLVDDRGVVRAEYRDELPSTGTLARDVESVVNEATTAGVSGMVYSAAHLFGCTGTSR